MGLGDGRILTVSGDIVKPNYHTFFFLHRILIGESYRLIDMRNDLRQRVIA